MSRCGIWYVPDMDDDHLVNLLRLLDDPDRALPSTHPPTLAALVAEARERGLDIPSRFLFLRELVEPLPDGGEGPIHLRKRARVQVEVEPIPTPPE